MYNKRTSSITKEDAYRNFDLINSGIKNIDFKISFLLIFVGIFIAFLSFNGKPEIFNAIPIIDFKNITNFPIKDLINLNFGQLFPILVVIILYILIISCFLLLLIALKGKTSHKFYKEYKLKSDNLLSFENISNMNYAIYKRKCKTLNNYELINDINSQTYINSIICNFKYKLYFYSMKLLIVSIVLYFICKILNFL